MNFHTLSELQKELQASNIHCIEVVNHYLNRIEEQKNINAFIEVFTEDALAKAKEVDAKIKAGTAGKLAGLVIGLKDNICYKGHAVSASSKILNGFESLYSATVTEKLLTEDAIIIGRLNCDEFAMGSANEFSSYGPVKNPHDNSRVTGGSSGGSAAAVAANLCHATLGSDTGGSIRQPASFCGVVGFKPSYGRVSRHGLISYASSFDQIGPFTKSVEDTALIYEVIAGTDAYDSTLSQKEAKVLPLPELKKPLKIAFLKDVLENEKLDKEIHAQTHNTIEQLRAQGHTVEGVDFPYMDYLVPIYYVLTTAEASSNLARYDGVHYGYRSEKATDLESIYKLSRTEGFGTEVKRRILLGTFVLSSGYYDAYYGKAQKARRLVMDETNKIFEDYDFIISPTTPGTAFPIGQEHKDPTVMYLEDIFTVQANIVGAPAVSLPLGNHSNGMPFGIQLMAPKFKEGELLAFAQTLMNKA